MPKKILILIFLILGFSFFGTEKKIIDFKIKNVNLSNQHWYLTDEDGAMNYGFFLFYHRSIFLPGYGATGWATTFYAEDHSLAPYNKKVTNDLIFDLTNTKYIIDASTAIIPSFGLFGLSGVITGIALISYGYSEYLKSSSYSYTDSFAGFKSDPFAVGSYILFVFCGTFTLISLIFIPVLAINFVKFKKLKPKVLDILNGNIVSYNENKHFKFAFTITNTL